MNIDDHLGSLQAHPIFVNFSNTQTKSIVPLLAHAQHPTTITTFKNIKVKCQWTNVFSSMIQATNQNNKMFVETMDQINQT